MIAAFIIAILPIQIEFSQEARPYIVFCFFALSAYLGLWLYIGNRRWRYLALLISCSAAGIYLHYSFGFVLLSLFSWWIIDMALRGRFAKDELYAFLASIFAVFTLFYYWLTPFLYKMALGRFDIFGLPARHLDPRREYSILGDSFDQLIWLSKKEAVFRTEIISIFLIKAAVASIVIFYLYSKRTEFIELLNRHRRVIIFLSWLAVFQVLAYIFSPQSSSYADITIKHIIPASLAAGILLAAFFAHLPLKARKVLFMLFAASIFTFIGDVIFNDEGWDPEFSLKKDAGKINENYLPGDLVLVYFGCDRTDLNHFLRPDIQAYAVYPIYPLDLKSDYLASRDTLGFLENEAQSRVFDPSEHEIDLKMNYYMDRSNPERVWLDGENDMVNIWFARNGWKRISKPSSDTIPSLYVKNSQ